MDVIVVNQGPQQAVLVTQASNSDTYVPPPSPFLPRSKTPLSITEDGFRIPPPPEPFEVNLPAELEPPFGFNKNRPSFNQVGLGSLQFPTMPVAL
ncbi:hypothetical protein Ciccas_004058 [Cichlidogyrus casuarinus]|uniref:Uncharacterized protein n=1 Tax=Cichlidogyrus casuarinus TaxID=1844966 RepID=A0ABD2QCL3_9PLAT